ncbi:MAG: peptidyl-prolyl cis-trans isomerase [bacterium]|nr:MAG: peptidyl-prolyl cis-trans isomerase [bacterium]
MNRILREPIVTFLIIGIAFYLLGNWISSSRIKENQRILVTSEQVVQLATQFSRTWMRPPTPDELKNLIASHIRDEVYYREALEMGLDANDQVIRSRLRQKLELLMSNLASANVPSDQILRNYLQQNPDKFRMEPKISFMQVYLNPDNRPDLETDARKILLRLQSGISPEEVGDPTLLGYEFEQYSYNEISRQFGIEFASQLIKIPPGDWVGPLYSGIGGHLVNVTEKIEGKMPELSEIRDLVEREWIAERTKELKDAAYKKLLERYEVTIEEEGRID